VPSTRPRLDAERRVRDVFEETEVEQRVFELFDVDALVAGAQRTEQWQLAAQHEERPLGDFEDHVAFG